LFGFRVGLGNSLTKVADLSAFVQANPVAHPHDGPNGDFEPDGTWYSMVAAKGALYAVEPNHGEVDRVRAHASDFVAKSGLLPRRALNVRKPAS
jgi:hypothetical protein